MGSSHPACLAKVDTGALSHDGGASAVMNGDLMYVAGGYGLAVFDLSDPAQPKRVGDVQSTGAIRSDKYKGQHVEIARLAAELVLVGNTLYVAGNKGLSIFDVSDPPAPKLVVEAFDTEAIADGSEAALAVRKNFLYVAGGKGFRVLDISSPTSPKPVGKVIDTNTLSFDGGAAMLIGGDNEGDGPTPGCMPCAGSTASTSIMYIAGGKGLSVFDVSVPDAPRKVGETLDIGASADSGAGAALSILGSNLYVAGGKGLAVMDISNPLQPHRLGEVITTDAISWASGAALAFVGCEDVTRTGTMLVAGGKGLRVMSLADPQKPEKIGEAINTGALSDEGGAQLVINGDYAYAIGGKGLVVVDLEKIGALIDATAPLVG